MTFINKILFESYLTEEKIVGFEQPSWGNFVVMMGSPGAGKSFAVQNFLNLRNFKHLTSDHWVELIGKKNNIDLKNTSETEKLNNHVSNTFSKYRKNFISQQLHKEKPENIVIEVTGKNSGSIKKLLHTIEYSNYTTTLVYIITSKDEAIRRNLQRERTVPIDFLIKVYDDIHHTYGKIMNLFDNVWIKYNDDVWEPFQGEEEFEIKNGKKILTSRAGTFERPTGQFLKIK